MNAQVTYYQNKLSFEVDPSDLFEALNKGEKVIVVDARKPHAFEAEHIPGAINIPHRTMSEDSTKHLNKSYLYVSYCDGIGCNASTKGALALAKLGFNVKELIGGIEWWKLDGYATKGAKPFKGAAIECAC